MNICFIGYGNMAKAIAEPLLSDDSIKIHAAAPSLLPQKVSSNFTTDNNNVNAMISADIVIIAVKPYQIDKVLEEIKGKLPGNILLISIVAGVPFSWFIKGLQQEVAIVRAMPNVLATVKCSATPLVANPFVDNSQKNKVSEIFNKIGISTWVLSEDQIDAYTSMSGSGPAYVFLFIKSLVEAGIKLGITEKNAREFVLQTLKGATKMVDASNEDVEHLIAKVTSSGGTTEAALNVFMQNNFSEIIQKAVLSAYNRAKALGDDTLQA